jgi:HSP20 family protein
MAKPHYSWLREIGQIHQEMEDLFFELCKPTRSYRRLAAGKWQPNADIYQSEEALVIHLELAGVSPADITVTADHDTLTVAGFRRYPEADRQTAYHQLEIHYGEFERVFRLPRLISSLDISATYENGFLTIRAVPKPAEKSPPRRIRIDG